MDNTAKKLKSIIKNPSAGKPPYGSNPMDPWSTKANISEATLDDYLSSRGINPKFVSKDTKISHAKSGEFIKWKNDRKMVGESSEQDLLSRYLSSRGVNPKYVTKDVKIAHSKSNEFKKWKNDHLTEAVDKRDTVVLDIPLLIRIMELSREDIKSDADLHRVVERLIQIRNKGVLTMADYKMIANITNIRRRHVKENHIAIAMGNMMDDEGSMVLNQLEQLERAIDMIRTYVGKDYTKQLPAWVQSKVTLATDYVDTVGNYLSSKNEQIEIDGVVLETYFGPRGDKLIATSHAAYTAGDKEKSSRAHKLAMKAGEKYRSNPANAAKATAHVMGGATQDYKDQEKKRGIGNVRDHVETEGELVEGKEANYGGSYQQSVLAVKAKAEKKPVDMKSLAARMQASYAKDKKEVKEGVIDAAKKAWKAVSNFDDPSPKYDGNTKRRQALRDKLKKKPVKEAMDSLAACSQPGDGANTPDDVAPEDKGKKLIRMSKSARIIKTIYKKDMTEETYDFEKDDKSSESKPYGKKPTFTATDKNKNAGENKPEAKAVMKGGTTLTGQPRDMVEIDPSMKNRPDRPDTFDKGNPKKSPV
jgi:hypothetical protein